MPKYPHNKVWINGKVVAGEEATVSIFSQAVLRGSCVYEGIRGYWSEARKNLFLWKIEPHLRRLEQSMKIMRMESPWTREDFRRAILEWIRANGFREDIHFRLNVFFDDAGRLDMKAFKPEEVDTCAFIAGGPRGDRARQQQGVHLCVSSWRRIGDDSVPPRVKATANYQNSRLASVEARVNGYDDAVILNQGGKVAESSGACVLIIRDGRLIAPPVTESILESVTRSCVIEMFGRTIGEAAERPVDRTELYIAEEAILCGSAEEVTPIVSVDRVAVGDGKPGPLTKRLQALFYAAVRGEDEGYERDLVPVY